MRERFVARFVALQRPRVVTIDSIDWETERHATISFRDDELYDAAPGTFCMVWVPGVDEVPMGLGFNRDGAVTLTVEAKGDCTKALLALQVGAKIGVRGPYGEGFDLPASGHAIFVGGGTGIAPMARGAQAAVSAGLEVTVISGARSKDLLLLNDYLRSEQAAGRLVYEPCTDDGSHGFDGFTTNRMEQLLESEEPASVYVAACGPEMMMVNAAKICQKRGVACQVSLERYMKCATGICDACTVGEGQRVCVEGPVFWAEHAQAMREFGVGHRDAAGLMHSW